MPIPVLQMSNNASSTLASAISNVSLTCTLSAGSGALFPSPAANQYFLMTFVDAATQTLREIVQCTARSGDTLTIVRAQEGTTALAWNASDLAVNMITAGTLQTYAQISQVQTGQFNYAVDSGTANNIIVNTVPAVTPPVDGMELTIRMAASNSGATTITFNGGTAVAVFGPNNAALQGGELIATTLVNLIYTSSGGRWNVISKISGTWPVIAATQSNQAVNLGQMNTAIGVANGKLLSVTILTATGTYTPTTGATYAYVYMVAGGGGGAGAAAGSATSNSVGGGGGSGTYVVIGISSPVATAVTVGAAGAAGAAGGNGGNGGNTVFGTYSTCLAGNGGTTSTVSNASTVSGGGFGGNVATTSGGNLIISSVGQRGLPGVMISGSAGTGGNGGSSPFGSGGFGSTDGTGGPAGAYGCGGGGALTTLVTTTGQAGGAGSAGVIIVWEYS